MCQGVTVYVHSFFLGPHSQKQLHQLAQIVLETTGVPVTGDLPICYLLICGLKIINDQVEVAGKDC